MKRTNCFLSVLLALALLCAGAAFAAQGLRGDLREGSCPGSESGRPAITAGSSAPLPAAALHSHEPGDPKRENEQPATCKSAACYDLVTYCTGCGEELSRETVFEGKPDPDAHDPQIAPYVSATCTEDGYAPFICTRCGKIIAKTDPDPALGHDYRPAYVWAKDNQKVTASLICSRCDNVQTTETVGVTEKILQAPNCSEPGLAVYTSGAFANKSFYVQTKEVRLPADQDAHVFRIVVTPPTCTEDGYTSHLCRKCRYGYADTPVAALGHTPPDENGNCTRCGAYVKDETVPIEPTTQPTTRQQQPSGGCKYCGRSHTGFPGVLIGFFHSVLALFGLRK